MNNSSAFNIDLARIDEIVISKAGIENNTDLISLDKGNYQFNIEFGFLPGVNIEAKKIRIIFSCTLQTLDLRDEPIGVNGYFDVVIIFQIDNIQELVIVEDDKLTMDRGLVATLANITYSTSRGIIYTRCQGTILKDIILPIISTDRLVDMIAAHK